MSLPYSILNIIIVIIIIIITAFVLTQIINGFQFFRKCPYCKKKFTRKTPEYYSCNYFVFGDTHVCYKCYNNNKDVVHLR